MATRWGVLSVGKISNDFTSALMCQDPTEHQVVAVAARSLERAQEFADRFGITTTYGSYEDLVKDPNVDIVYIGAIHITHYELSMLCLNAGKHVLVEKPMTLTLAAAKVVHQTAKEKKLFFMEGYWTRFFPIYQRLQEELSAKTIGDIVMIQAGFSLITADVERIKNKKLGGGGLFDIGCYPVMLADFIFKELPEKISAEGQVSDTGVDFAGVITMRFSEGRIANLMYNTRTTLDNNDLTISGTKGFIRVENPCWCPTKMTLPSEAVQTTLPTAKVKMNFPNSEGFVYEQRHVRECLMRGDTQSPIMTHASSENILNTLETVLEQMDAKYDFPHPV